MVGGDVSADRIRFSQFEVCASRVSPQGHFSLCSGLNTEDRRSSLRPVRSGLSELNWFYRVKEQTLLLRVQPRRPAPIWEYVQTHTAETSRDQPHGLLKQHTVNPCLHQAVQFSPPKPSSSEDLVLTAGSLL